MFAVALIAAISALRLRAVLLDESVYKLAAVRYTHDVPGSIWLDGISRGVARLYSILIAPVFAVLTGDVAVRVARVLGGVAWALAAIPVTLLARRVTTNERAAVAAGLLSIAVPWLTVATILFSESLAYLLTMCLALAMVRALEAPSLQREAIVLALLVAVLTTRVQLAALAVAWVLLLVVLVWWPAWREGRRDGLVAGLKRFPLSALAVGGVVLVLLAIVATQGNGVRRLLGPYSSLGDRGGVPGEFGVALLWQVGIFALGVGLLPMILAASWTREALRGARDAAAFRVAAVALAAVGSVWLAALLAQGGWLDLRQEERYYVYAVPFLWIGAVGALELARPSVGRIAAIGVPIVLVLYTLVNPIGLVAEQAFLGPVSAVARQLGPEIASAVSDVTGVTNLVSGRDVLGVIGALLLAALLVAWRRRGPALALGIAAAFQILVGGLAFATVNGAFSATDGLVTGPSFAQLGWVDRANAGGEVTFADNVLVDRDRVLRDTIFWNDDVTAYTNFTAVPLPPPPYPIVFMPHEEVGATPDLFLNAQLPRPGAVQAIDGPNWQLAGARRAVSPDGTLELLDPGKTPRLRWLLQGLEPDGMVSAPASIIAAGGQRVTLDLVQVRPDTETRARIRIGGERRTYVSTRGAEQRLTFDLCDRERPAPGAIEPTGAAPLPDGRAVAVQVRSVHVEPCA